MRWLIVTGALALLAACVAEFPATAPEPLPDPDAEMQEPEPDGTPDPEPEADAAPDPEPDAAVEMPDLGPQPEACNGADDDLDGIIDEDFALNSPCADADGICGLTACAADGSAAQCVAGPDGVQQGEESCNGVDDDCDGTLDEGFDVAVECMVGQGVCAVFGLQVCAEDGAGTVCDAMAGEPAAAEFCANGDDDDCDGQTDEGECE